MNNPIQALSQAVHEATAIPELPDAVAGLYAEIQQQIDRLQPACRASGQCCHFETFGHRLFVTTAELAVFLLQLRSASPAHEAAASLVTRSDGDSCRFQDGKLCMAHLFRPMGCRLFYCDPKATPLLQPLYETCHQQLKRLHERLDIPYHYVEWRTGLQAILPADSPRP